jgi:DNA-binding transcriptional LysR family regulator
MRIGASLVCMNERQLGWDDLRIVLAISQGGTLAAAAERLGVSHATVFRRLNQIEEQLGVRLFERRRVGYTPTAAGAEATALAGRLENDIAALERRIAGRDQRAAGTVRITTTDTLLYGPLSAVLPAFRRAHPQIVLELTVSNTLFDLDKGEADVAIRPSREPPPSMVGRRISAVAMAVYGWRGIRGAEPGTLGRFDWAAPDESLVHTPARRWLEDKGLLSRAVYRANSLFALREAARHGVGLAVLPCYLGDPDPQLMRVGAPVPELQSELWLLTHPQLRRTARVSAFVNTLARLLKPLVPLFEGHARPGSGNHPGPRT